MKQIYGALALTLAVYGSLFGAPFPNNLSLAEFEELRTTSTDFVYPNASERELLVTTGGHTVSSEAAICLQRLGLGHGILPRVSLEVMVAELVALPNGTLSDDEVVAVGDLAAGMSDLTNITLLIPTDVSNGSMMQRVLYMTPQGMIEAESIRNEDN